MKLIKTLIHLRKICQSHHITIPSHMVRKLDLHAGDVCAIYVDNDKMIITFPTKQLDRDHLILAALPTRFETIRDMFGDPSIGAEAIYRLQAQGKLFFDKDDIIRESKS